MLYADCCYVHRTKGRNSSAKPGRRITLTPLGSQQLPSLHQFSSTTTSGNCWKTNPAFTNHFTSSESPASLSEERKLLQQERSRRRQKHGNRTAPTQRDVFHKPGMTTRDHSNSFCTEGGKSQVPMKADKGNSGHMHRSLPVSQKGQYSGQSVIKEVGHHHRSREEEASLDHRLSNHSIFELNSSARGKHSTHSANRSHSQHSAPTSRIESTHSATLGQGSLSLHDASLNHPPLTSTPLLSVDCGHVQVSPAEVTHWDTLDLLSGHYASLITGTSL